MFVTDPQTQSDLSVFKRIGGLCELFDGTKTLGGAVLLREFFYRPLSSIADINERQSAIKYMPLIELDHILDKFKFDDLEKYLRSNDEPYTISTRRYLFLNMTLRLQPLRYQRERLLIARSVAELAELFIFLEKLIDQNATNENDQQVYVLRIRCVFCSI